jgi:signal transduction histidine kinase
MNARFKRPVPPVLLAGALLMGIYAAMVVSFRASLREQIRQTVINRNAAVLRPVALRQLAQRETAPADPAKLLAAVLESAQQEDMLAVAVFDAQGHAMQFAPHSLLFAELPLDDYLRLLKAEPISRFYPDFPLDRYFAGVGPVPTPRSTPVLEVLLPLHGRDAGRILGFAQYYIDGRPLAGELTSIDRRVNRQTAATLGIGAVLIVVVVTVAFFRVRRAHDRLVKANFELALAAKASALGQITSHLIHGLQGSVAGLRAVVAGRDPTTAEQSDWETAAGYTDRMQALIHEAVALLGDTASNDTFELTGPEFAALVHDRNATAAAEKGVAFSVAGSFGCALDSHRGGLLCLITSNLVQNAVEATDAGRSVTVALRSSDDSVSVIVSDEGHGIAEEIRAHLFEPGRTNRAGGSGLGLAISRLLARQIGATLVLDSTGADGTTFSICLPLVAALPRE